MFDKPYPFQKLETTKTFQKNPVEITHYRFIAAKRKYFVTLELFDFGIAAIKYCDLADRKSPRTAYKKIFNDNDAFRVIGTCLHIMYDYWKIHPNISFAFYAVPREQINIINKGTPIPEKERQLFIDKYERIRFRIYNYAMVNLFPPHYFRHLRDKKSNVYALINTKEPNYRILIQKMTAYLLNHFDMIFEPEKEN